MLRSGKAAGALGRVGRQIRNASTAYKTGVKPTLYFGSTEPTTTLNVSETEWTQLVAGVFGAPLTNYYVSRYPNFSQEDLEKAREELQNSFFITGDWRKRYAEINAPAELYKCRARIEAELDPLNLEKLRELAEDQDPATADPFIELRLKEAELAKASSAAEVPGALSPPSFNWDLEYQNNKQAASEKRSRYEQLERTEVAWDSSLPQTWLAPFRSCTNDLHKDIDIDYLRYMEGHLRDQVRAEKWYTRLAEDGEETLTYEEVEAWMPEYFDTLMIDYDNWWEMVSRGSDTSQWDRFSATYEQHHQALAEKYNAEKAMVQDTERLDRHFAPRSLFEAFRQPPVVDAAFAETAAILPQEEVKVQVA